MLYKDIKKYFKTEAGIEELLEILAEKYFDPIDSIAQQLVSDALPEAKLRETKTRLSGMVGSLNIAYSNALSLKKQKEYRYVVEHRTEGSAAYLEKASKDFVLVFRDIRDTVCGYIKCAESSLFDCKDRIEKISKEYGNQEK